MVLSFLALQVKWKLQGQCARWMKAYPPGSGHQDKHCPLPALKSGIGPQGPRTTCSHWDWALHLGTVLTIPMHWDWALGAWHPHPSSTRNGPGSLVMPPPTGIRPWIPGTTISHSHTMKFGTRGLVPFYPHALGLGSRGWAWLTAYPFIYLEWVLGPSAGPTQPCTLGWGANPAQRAQGST